MAFVHRAFGLLLLAFLALSTVPASAEEEADDQVLSASQIVRFINSYPAIHAMARNYWGERKHTPTHKMLKSKGTFERAITEMKWAGKLPEFDNLLQSAGFDNRKVWMALVKRISRAHMILRLKEVNPEQLERYRQNRRRQLAEIQEKIRALQDTSDGTPTVYLGELRKSEHRLKLEGFAEKDAEALGPYYTRFEAMNNTIAEYRR